MKQIINSSKKVYCGIDFHKNTSTLCALSQDGKQIEPLITVKTKMLVQYLSNKKAGHQQELWRIGHCRFPHHTQDRAPELVWQENHKLHGDRRACI